MITIRRNVFETNSSSTHAVAVLPKDVYQKLKNDDDLWYHEKYGVCTTEKVKELLPEFLSSYGKEAYADESKDPDFDFKQFMYEYADDWYWIDKYEENECYYEEDIHEYTTKSGDEIVIICNYGQDG